MTEESRELAPTDAERGFLMNEIRRLREQHPEMVYIAFPGDEKSSGGCVLYEKRELDEAIIAQSVCRNA